MDDGTTYMKNRLSRFLATYPTKLHYTLPESFYNLVVFWSQNEGSPNNSSSDDSGLIPDPRVIHEKIKSLFSELQKRHFLRGGVLFQFWAPVTTGGRQLLTTSKQPFAITFLVPELEKYRLSCLKYQYNIDVNRHEVGEDPTIISGAHAGAFLNHLPEVVLDRRFLQGCPLGRSSLKMPYFVLPICDPSQNSCVGVIECAMKEPDYLFEIFNDLNAALEGMNLCTFHVQACLPYKTIHGLKRAKDEIEEALMNVCDTLNLHLAQVWIACEEENHVPFSSSFEGTQMKQMYALKLAGCCLKLDSLNQEFVKEYYDTCDKISLKGGMGLAEKTLQNYKPHFCTNTSNLSSMEQLIYKYNCFTICLRSINTGDFDYAFEFFWIQRQDPVLLLELLLLALKKCLPNFKFVSGAELGDELHIVDVADSLEREIEFFKIFKEKRSSQDALEEGRGRVVEKCIAHSRAKCKTTPIPLPRANIEQQFGRTMKEAAKNLDVSLSTLKRKCNILGISEWQGPNFVKRKVNDSCKNQIDTIEEDNIAIQDPLVVNRETMYSDENTLTIKAEYGDDVIKFHLLISLATFAAVEMKIGQKFRLNNATYKLKYIDEDGEWILMISDQDMKDCIKSWRNLNRTAIRLRVVPIKSLESSHYG